MSRVTALERTGLAIALLLDDAGEERTEGALDAVARAVGLSRFRFQRLFRSHTGITPAAFRNAARLVRARTLLRAGRPVLDAAFGAGFSGPGRLHDVAVTHEALSPGELARHGAGVPIRYSFERTPLGPCLIASTPRGICALRFARRAGDRGLRRELAAEWPAARLVHAPGAHAAIARSLCGPGRSPGRLRLHVRGTNWQVQVWRALMAIPPGVAVSYRGLARALGRPRAARAVGNAVAANPVAMLIPCHRVIRASGVVGGYRWGPTRKRALLAWERARLAGGGAVGSRP